MLYHVFTVTGTKRHGHGSTITVSQAWVGGDVQLSPQKLSKKIHHDVMTATDNRQHTQLTKQRSMDTLRVHTDQHPDQNNTIHVQLNSSKE